jgi:hypothetical protein
MGFTERMPTEKIFAMTLGFGGAFLLIMWGSCYLFSKFKDRDNARRLIEQEKLKK